MSGGGLDPQLTDAGASLTIFVIGASGDLACKKTYPSLYELFLLELLPPLTSIVGYARSASTDDVMRTKWGGFLKAGTDAQRAAFLSLCSYRAGGYDDEESFGKAATECAGLEAARSVSGRANRIFYFAIPPSVFEASAKTVSNAGRSSKGWNRIVVEKPFGRDSESSAALGRALAQYFDESSIYRIDHYLGKEMVQNLMVLRFANAIFEPLWNCDHISNVQITFKEPFGTEGRGGYFDEFGIIRDVLQNHLTQVLSLVAMEAPVSLASEDVRDEKVKVLRCVAPIELSDVVLGQYGANAAGTKVGYLDDATVPRDSVTPTFAVARLHINNARWHGVPFILKAGKALNERKAEIRIQFKSSKSGLFNAGEGPIGVGQTPGFAANMHPNELVIRIQPDEAIYVKLMSRLPGLEFSPVETDLALAYSSRFANRASPEAYSRLIYDVIRGEQSQFVRADELVAAWSIFTPLLRRIETERIQPFQYPYGSRGPPQGDMLIQKAGYVWEARYAGAWNKGNVPGAALTALKAVRDEFSLPTARLAKIAANMLGEMREGLAGRPSTVKMIPSFVTAVPTGRESGSSWAIDLGGSNLRVLEVLLEVGQSPRIGREHKVVIPEEVMRGTGAALFDFIATACADAGMVSGAKLGFTFSFPYEQTSISRGTLIEWTKGFSAPNVVGKDVAVLLEEAFVRRSLRIAVSALANDTVGTLCSAAGTHPTTRVGVILGTGTNASYIEQVSRIPKWRGSSQGAMLINMEWGGFGSSAAPLLPLHAVDQSLDVQTPNVGKQRFEKMISGMYLGEIARLLLVQLSAAGGLFAHEGPTVATSKLFTPWSLTTAMLSEIGDDITANLDVVENVLQRLGVAPITAEDKKVVVEVCSLVACRAARLSAAGVAAVITQMGDVGVGSVVGIDGSVFKKTPGFRVAMENALRELGVDCKLVHAEDGSGIGAALIACVT